jgi:hypothetical protein
MKYFVMEMPVTADGQGPATEEETARVLYELWNPDLVTVATFDTYAEAQRAADIINEDLEGVLVRGR